VKALTTLCNIDNQRPAVKINALNTILYSLNIPQKPKLSILWLFDIGKNIIFETTCSDKYKNQLNETIVQTAN